MRDGDVPAQGGERRLVEDLRKRLTAGDAGAAFQGAAYTVSQRIHEVGIRMALGARPADVVRLVVGQAMLLVACGLAVGAAAAAGLTRLVGSALVGIGAGDPGVFLGAALILGTVAALASFVPAQRAAGVDPVVALRHE